MDQLKIFESVRQKMTGPNTRQRKSWTLAEDKRLIIGLNKYWEERDTYKRIQTDLSLNFLNQRSNVDIKDRIRIIFCNLKSFKSFFIPIDCDNPHDFIPEEYWGILGLEDFEIVPERLPEGERFPLNYVLYKYSTIIDPFIEVLECLPAALDADPLLNSKTWFQICRKCFTGRNKLSENKMTNLLDELLINGYIKAKRIGIRAFVFKS